MSNVLTCWKEIATHLGKSMRTVQRSEREMGLPVRRPTRRDTGSVFAVPEELDAWIRSQARNGREARETKLRSEFDALQTEIRKLQAENEILRRGLQSLLEKEATVPASDSDLDAIGLRQLWNRSFRVLISNAQKRLEFRELLAKANKQSTLAYSDPIVSPRIPLRVRDERD
jgi:hypothetical protein